MPYLTRVEWQTQQLLVLLANEPAQPRAVQLGLGLHEEDSKSPLVHCPPCKVQEVMLPDPLSHIFHIGKVELIHAVQKLIGKFLIVHIIYVELKEKGYEMFLTSMSNITHNSHICMSIRHHHRPKLFVNSWLGKSLLPHNVPSH